MTAATLELVVVDAVELTVAVGVVGVVDVAGVAVELGSELADDDGEAARVVAAPAAARVKYCG